MQAITHAHLLTTFTITIPLVQFYTPNLGTYDTSNFRYSHMQNGKNNVAMVREQKCRYTRVSNKKNETRAHTVAGDMQRPRSASVERTEPFSQRCRYIGERRGAAT